MSKERELLERAYYVLGELSYAMLKDSGEYNLAGDIYEYLASEKQDQPEPVAWMNGMRNLLSWDKFYEDMSPLYLHPAPVVADSARTEEPVAWMLISTVGSRHYHMSEQQALKGLQMYGGKVIALYDHPAPQRSFVRLKYEEIWANDGIMSVNAKAGLSMHLIYEFTRAVEDALEEKNR